MPIISTARMTVDRVDKFEQYKKAEVAYYWILDPKARSLEGFRLHRGAYVATGEGRDQDVISLPPFPKLNIPLAKLWWPEPQRSAPAKRRRSRNGNGH
jgi:Uma2 family endonuclease